MNEVDIKNKIRYDPKYRMLFNEMMRDGIKRNLMFKYLYIILN